MGDTQPEKQVSAKFQPRGSAFFVALHISLALAFTCCLLKSLALKLDIIHHLHNIMQL
jgi:hypothetical protein